MREADFRIWVEEHGARSEKGRDTRVYAVSTIEKNLVALGSPHADLDAAFEADGFGQLHARLEAMQSDAKQSGKDYRILMPSSEKPLGRLASWRSWLRQYGRFLGGDQADAESEAGRIRLHVLETYIEPAREHDDDAADVLVKEVNDTLGLDQAWPNICQALEGGKFQELADVPPPQRIGRPQSTATVFRFDLDRENYWALATLRRNFGEPIAETKKMAAFALPDGRQLALDLEAARTQLWVEAEGQAFGHLDVEITSYAADKSRHSNLPVRLRQPRPALKLTIPNAAMLQEVLAHYGHGSATLDAIAKSEPNLNPEARAMPAPTNLILYGPPGTGKTFATATEAVRLCGEVPPDDRDDLMEAYKQLAESGRIEFVTFHQSMAYEDFVEGLRPTTSGMADTGADAGDVSSGGFRLTPHDGIFKQLSERARLSRPADSSRRLDRKRAVFKIALGRRGEEENRIDEGLQQGLIHLGWGGTIDWSDDRYDTFEPIRREWLETVDSNATGKDPNIEMMYTFRAAMRPGDYVVLSDGRDIVRAVGEITGEYFYDPTADFHPHRRKVSWLWQEQAGVPRDRFYPRQFRRHSTYQLSAEAVDWDSLDEIVFGDDLTAHSIEALPHVLIIDEINRANISKVFGELITLIEHDKRLGMTNAVRVRLPYSHDMFGVPANLHIIGTMNTADRSIALLDTALRRRFEFRELMPVPSLLSPVEGVDLAAFLTTINNRIEYLFDREHQIGHAYFLDCRNLAALDAVMRHRVIPLLAEYFHEDWGKVAAVLGDPEGDHFLKREVLKAPPGLEQEGGEDRYRWLVRAEHFTAAAYAHA